MKRSIFLFALLATGIMFCSGKNNVVIAAENVTDNERINSTLADFNFISDLNEVSVMSEESSESSEAMYTIDDQGRTVVTSNDGLSEFVFDANGDIESVDQYSLLNEIDEYGISNMNIEEDTSFDEYVQYVIDTYVPEEYALEDSYDLMDDYYQIVCYRVNDYGVKNIYDQIKITLHKSAYTVLGYNHIDEYEVTQGAEITENDALEIVEAFCEDQEISLDDQQYKETILTTARENDCFENVNLDEMNEEQLESYLAEQDERAIHTVYEVQYGDIIFYVDAISGTVIGVDGYAATVKDGMSYYVNESGSPFASCASNLNSVMNKLGYNTSTKAIADGSSGAGSSALSHAKKFLAGDGNNWAFCFSGHASTTVLADRHVNWAIRQSDVYGGWKFVFLNGCNTANGTGWSDKFGIYDGSSGKIFLGWYDSVLYTRMKEYCGQLKTALYAHSSDAFYENVVRALDGPNYYCLRFRGDKKTQGKA